MDRGQLIQGRHPRRRRPGGRCGHGAGLQRRVGGDRARAGTITTAAASSTVVTAFGLGDPVTWSPGAGETLIGYATSGTAAGGASHETAAAGGHAMSWSGLAAARPTLLLAAYEAATATGPATPQVLGAATRVNVEDVLIAGFTAPAGGDRALVVAVSAEDAIFSGVTFDGQAMAQVGQVVNGANTVRLYELREAALGAGARTGDIVVDVYGGITQAVAFTLSGVDQAAGAVTAQASNGGTAETALAGAVTTGAASSIIVTAFGLGDPATWAPGAGETLIGYRVSDGVTDDDAAVGASHETVGAGSHTMSWSGAAARRPTMLLAAYAAAAPGGGGTAGAVVESYAYGPYGEGTGDGPPDGIPYRYAGQRYDPETGLIYMRARYYSVAQGRFLSADPIGYIAGPNLYAYVGNNPINFIDPLGLLIETPFDAFSASVGLTSLLDNVARDQFILAGIDAVGFLYDAFATAVPGLPGGASLLIQAGRRGGDVVDVARKAFGSADDATLSFRPGSIQAHKAQGDAFQSLTADKLKKSQTGQVQELLVETEEGVRTRLDIVGRDIVDGTIQCTECKSSAKARLTKNQALAFPEMVDSGATVVGKGRPGFPGGTKIPPTSVKIVRP